jgi:hypothetical protein
MSAFPGSPRLVKGGIVLVDPESGTINRISVPRSQQKADTRSFDDRPVKRSVR